MKSLKPKKVITTTCGFIFVGTIAVIVARLFMSEPGYAEATSYILWLGIIFIVVPLLFAIVFFVYRMFN